MEKTGLFQCIHQGNQFIYRFLLIATFSTDSDSGTFNQTQSLQFEQALSASRFTAADHSYFASLTNCAAGRVCRPFSAVISTDFSYICSPQIK